MTEICRTCLQEVVDGSSIFYLDNTIRCKLARCVPELDLSLVPNAVICGNCFESLNTANEFKTKCLEAEARIKSYIQQEGYIFACVDLKQVVQHKEEPPPPPSLSFNEDNTSKLRSVTDPSYLGSILGESTPLDITNLQCNTQELFAVPKIAQLLAGENSKPVTCEWCGFTARNDLDLRNHVRKRHATDSHERPSYYKCDSCDFTSIYVSALNRHVKIHAIAEKSRDFRGGDDKKPYKCLLCEYSSSRKSNLGHHMMLHGFESGGTRKKSYKCKMCKYRAARKTRLRDHVKLRHHAADTICTFCDYKCGTSANLIRHLSFRHSDVRPFQCYHCDYKTDTKQDLETHEAVQHDDNESTTCAICEKRFENVEGLKGHVNFHEIRTQSNPHLQSNGNKPLDLYSFRNVPDVSKSVAD